MNFEEGPPSINNVQFPPPPFRGPEVQDLEENSPRSQNDTSTTSTSTQSSLFLKYLPYVAKPILYIFKGISSCLSSFKSYIWSNKITAFMTLQLIFIFLRLSHVINEKALFWLTFIPIFLILLVVVLHLCITAQRNSNAAQRQQQQQQNLRQNDPFRVPQGNLRRTHGLDQINERLMEQILMNAAPNRLDLFITGNGGRMRLMHLEPDIHNLNGTRMQIRLISRGLLRLLAEFIEEQQLQQSRNQRNGLTEEQINNIPLEKYLIPLNGIEEAETCSICIDEFKQEQELRRLPCNHKFHRNCIDEWLKISNSCPNCKLEVVPTAAQATQPQEP